jgi:uncharacterized protein YegL
MPVQEWEDRAHRPVPHGFATGPEPQTHHTPMIEQTPFHSKIVLANNPEPRCPCVLVLDTSGSMSGEAIRQLNTGVQSLVDELCRDGLASKRVELAVITFGSSVNLACDFTPPTAMHLPVLEAGGPTPMGEAVLNACAVIESRKEEYRQAGIQYYRPWIFLITDGEPSDFGSADWIKAVREVRDGEAAKRLLFFGVAVEDANQKTLDALCPPSRPSVRLRGLHFSEMFRWLSSSLKSVSNSTPGAQLQLPSPNGWTAIDA